MYYIPYRKLWTKFFPPYGAGHKKREKQKKTGSITYGTDQANEVNKMFIIWLQTCKRAGR